MNEKSLMHMCLELAQKGSGNVNPNPMVGCVIVRDGKIVGKGFHQQFGGPHAEVVALKRAHGRTDNSTLFVNLEPCVHFGKTPPCTDTIIRSGIAKVVIAVKDPNPLVKGKGIKRLQKAGIKVKVGMLKKEAELLNEKFFRYMRTGLPFVGVKLAQTLDGRIADINRESKWITSDASRKAVHILRSQYDAVLIGAETVMRDNPELTVRLVKGRNPVRIVADGRLSVPISRKIFNTNEAATWVLTSTASFRSKRIKVHRLAAKGVRVIGIPSLSSKLNPRSILKILSKEGISSVLIEGGARTVSPFVKQDIIDKFYIFIAPKIIGGGVNAFHFEPSRLLKNSIKMKIKNISSIGEDILVEADYYNK